MEENKDYVPDGSGTMIIRICDSDGNLISTQYKNLSEVCVLKNESEEK